MNGFEIDFISVLIGFVILFVILVASRAVKIIRPYEKGVVERFGRYNRVLDSGLNFIIPVIENAFRVDMREAMIDVPSQEVITVDNVSIQVDAIVYFKVVDPFKVMYNVAMFEDAVSNLAQTTLRDVVGRLKLDRVFGAREKINLELRKSLDDVTGRWGVRVTRVELQDVIPPKDIVDAMSQQMKAERTKRASVLEAEGFRQAEVLKARGRRDAQVLDAEGQSKAIKMVADAEREQKAVVAEGEAKAIERVFGAIHEGKPTKDLIALKYLEALEKMAQGNATKIFMPFETSGILSSAAILGEMFNESKNTGGKLLKEAVMKEERKIGGSKPSKKK
ncbi:MAG TPA: SPFH/Band 7/PHB domain protein [Candidatus Altiarchaeales archaeon]|nr:SPFH/Band 7/PHB domain protein [Candidatus Altiarchaeales archaeon]